MWKPHDRPRIEQTQHLFTACTILVWTILLSSQMVMSESNNEKETMVQTKQHSSTTTSVQPSIDSRAYTPMDIFVFIVSCLCVIIALVGVLGNLLVICVLTGSSNRLVYETFCVGLAWTDLTYLTLTSPITVVQYYLRMWIFGMFWCKVFNFIVQVTVFSTAFMLLGLTTSRFLSVVLPWQNLKMTELQAKLFCLGAWCVGIIFAIPILIFQVIVPTSPPIISNQTTLITSQMNMTDSVRTTLHTITTLPPPTPVARTDVFCREKFPSQTSRVGYQIFVLLSTYVLPFVGIIIMNSIIVYKLQKRSVMDRHAQRNQNPTVKRSSRDGPDESRRGTFQRLIRTNKDNLAGYNDAGNAPNRKSISGSTMQTGGYDPDSLTPAELMRLRKDEQKRKLRTKATKLVVLVTSLWCICWLPTHIINSWFHFDEASFPFVSAMKVAKLISQVLSFAASCVNPVVYGIMTGTFKNTMKHRIFRRKRPMSGECTEHIRN